jgi:hypothetical protein
MTQPPNDAEFQRLLVDLAKLPGDTRVDLNAHDVVAIVSMLIDTRVQMFAMCQRELTDAHMLPCLPPEQADHLHRDLAAALAERDRIEARTVERIVAMLETFAASSGWPQRVDAYRYVIQGIREHLWKKETP